MSLPDSPASAPLAMPAPATGDAPADRRRRRAALALSPDFRPAYDPLLGMAGVLARSDAAAARALLNALRQVQPARPEAGLALRALAEAAR